MKKKKIASVPQISKSIPYLHKTAVLISSLTKYVSNRPADTLLTNNQLPYLLNLERKLLTKMKDIGNKFQIKTTNYRKILCKKCNLILRLSESNCKTDNYNFLNVKCFCTEIRKYKI